MDRLDGLNAFHLRHCLDILNSRSEMLTTTLIHNSHRGSKQYRLTSESAKNETTYYEIQHSGDEDAWLVVLFLDIERDSAFLETNVQSIMWLGDKMSIRSRDRV